MNIWYFSAYDRPRGHSSRTYDFARMLSAKGHKVSIFTNSVCHYTQEDRLDGKQKWLEEEIDDLTVTWLKTPKYSNNMERFINMLWNAFRALQAGKARHDRPDIIVGPTVPLFTSWAAQRLAKRYNSPFFLEIRDIWPQTFVDLGKMRQDSFLFHALRWLEKSLYKSADTIVTTLPLGAKHVDESGGDPEKVIWIPNGVDLDRFTDVSYPGRKIDAPIHFVYTGSFGSGNDLLPVIEACQKVEEVNPLWTLTLVGGGNQQDEIESLIKKYGLEEKIKLPGYVMKHEIPDIVRTGDAMLISLRPGDYFRFGCNINKMYDYYAAGRPVIFAGNVPNDSVKLSGCGYSVPANDVDELSKAMLAFMGLSFEQRKQLGERARQYAEENFDVRKLATILEKKMLQSIGEV